MQRPRQLSGRLRLVRRPNLFVEQARVLSHTAYPAEQYRMVMHAPRCAANARPANFVHLRCSDTLALRRPYSIMSAFKEEGCIEILYKVVGKGSGALSQQKIGNRLSLIGPIGNGFTLHRLRPELLLLGGGVGIPPIFFLAKQVKQNAHYDPLVLLGSEVPFPFALTHSQLEIGELEDDCNLASAELEALGIRSRLASGQKKPACFDGYLDAFARGYLAKVGARRLARTELFACGPLAMLKSIAKLSAEFQIPCKMAVEEYMACGVGGCAACAVPVLENGKATMKRVCVDGPVFQANQLFANQLLDGVGEGVRECV